MARFSPPCIAQQALPYHAGGRQVMFNPVAQGGYIAVDAQVIKVVALVDIGFGALLSAVE